MGKRIPYLWDRTKSVTEFLKMFDSLEDLDGSVVFQLAAENPKTQGDEMTYVESGKESAKEVVLVAIRYTDIPKSWIGHLDTSRKCRESTICI